MIVFIFGVFLGFFFFYFGGLFCSRFLLVDWFRLENVAIFGSNGDLLSTPQRVAVIIVDCISVEVRHKPAGEFSSCLHHHSETKTFKSQQTTTTKMMRSREQMKVKTSSADSHESWRGATNPFCFAITVIDYPNQRKASRFNLRYWGSIWTRGQDKRIRGKCQLNASISLCLFPQFKIPHPVQLVGFSLSISLFFSFSLHIPVMNIYTFIYIFIYLYIPMIIVNFNFFCRGLFYCCFVEFDENNQLYWHVGWRQMATKPFKTPSHPHLPSPLPPGLIDSIEWKPPGRFLFIWKLRS